MRMRDSRRCCRASRAFTWACWLVITPGILLFPEPGVVALAGILGLFAVFFALHIRRLERRRYPLLLPLAFGALAIGVFSPTGPAVVNVILQHQGLR